VNANSRAQNGRTKGLQLQIIQGSGFCW